MTTASISALEAFALASQAGLHSYTLDGDASRWADVGIGARSHGRSRTGSARRARLPILTLMLQKSRDGVIGAGRAQWDWLSMNQIGEWTGYSTRHCRRAVRELEALGLVRTEERVGGTSTYHLVLANLKKVAQHFKDRTIQALQTAKLQAVERFRGHGLVPDGLLPQVKNRAAARQDLSVMVDAFDQVFGRGAALNVGFSERTARRLMRERDIDETELVDEMSRVHAALEHDTKSPAATAVRERHALITRSKMWAELAAVGRRHL